MSGVEEPGHSDEKWATGTRRQKWEEHGRCWNVTVQVSSGREEEVGPVGSSIPKTDGETNIQKKELLSPLEISFTHPGRDDFA